MFFPVKVPWSNQPPVGARVDWSHPLASGLVVAYFAWDLPVDRLGNTGSVDGTTPIPIGEKKAIRAVSFGSATSNDSIDIPNNAISRLEGKSAATIMVYGRVPATGMSEFGYFYSSRDAGGQDVIFSQYRPNGAGNNKASFFVNGVEALGNDSFFDANNYRWYCVRWDGATAIFHRDDTQWGSSALSSTVGTGIAAPAFGNTADDSVDRGLPNADIVAALTFDRDIGQPAMLAIQENFWQIFEPRTVWYSIAAAAGGLVIPTAMHSYRQRHQLSLG